MKKKRQEAETRQQAKRTWKKILYQALYVYMYMCVLITKGTYYITAVLYHTTWTDHKKLHSSKLWRLPIIPPADVHTYVSTEILSIHRSIDRSTIHRSIDRLVGWSHLFDDDTHLGIKQSSALPRCWETNTGKACDNQSVGLVGGGVILCHIRPINSPCLHITSRRCQ